jgi:MYM-type Zinc finger with FCS sequence motif
MSKEKEKCDKCEELMYACECRKDRVGFRGMDGNYLSEAGSDVEEDDVWWVNNRKNRCQYCNIKIAKMEDVYRVNLLKIGGFIGRFCSSACAQITFKNILLSISSHASPPSLPAPSPSPMPIVPTIEPTLLVSSSSSASSTMTPQFNSNNSKSSK